MDPDFLKQLDDHISNIGIDEYWKRRVGKHLIWFSPLTNIAQGKVNETLATEDLGVNAIAETKIVTLSHAIIGIDEYDLREYRDGGAVFSIPDPRNKQKTIKVTLDKYIHSKISQWGNDWTDLAFDVFADLMETFSKENRKDVQFDNIKEPREKLNELEMQVAELREELGLPQLVETEILKEGEEEEEEAPEKPEKASEKPSESGTPFEDFDPFKAAPDTTESQEKPIIGPPSTPEVPPQPPVVHKPIQEAPANPQAVVSVPTPDPTQVSPIQHAMAQRAQAQRAQANMGNRIIDAQHSSPEQPINPTPSIATDEIVDQKIEKSGKPIKIDKKTKHQSRNPRFRKPNR